MAHKSVFIAGASESKEGAKAIAQELRRRRNNALIWWEQFPPGSITIERLLEIAKKVDAAVFICSGVDKVRYRSSTASVPRDNVILEYGIFLGVLGPERCLLLKDEGTRLPTDLHSLNYGSLVDDLSTVAKRVADHFDEVFAEHIPLSRLESLITIADPELIAKINSGRLPAGTRSLYIGPEGADAWLTVSEDSAYQSEEVKAEIKRNILDVVKNIVVRTFVSLGPGDGRLDRDIAVVLRNRAHSLKYIPVDISYELLQIAYEMLAQQVQVLMGIHADFEDGFPFIHEQVRRYAKSPILFGIIGNTFGNLESCESRFTHSIKSSMSKSDYLLIEVAAIKKGAQSRPIAPSITSISKSFQHFLSSRIAHRLGVSGDSVMNEIERFIQISVSDNSNVPGTQTLEFKALDNNQIIANIRRYDLKSLETWLKDKIGLKIIESRRIESPAVVDRGLLLVKRQVPRVV